MQKRVNLLDLESMLQHEAFIAKFSVGGAENGPSNELVIYLTPIPCYDMRNPQQLRTSIMTLRLMIFAKEFA